MKIYVIFVMVFFLSSNCYSQDGIIATTRKSVVGFVDITLNDAHNPKQSENSCSYRIIDGRNMTAFVDSRNYCLKIPEIIAGCRDDGLISFLASQGALGFKVSDNFGSCAWLAFCEGKGGAGGAPFGSP